jgi:preprotein translocase subunit SecG
MKTRAIIAVAVCVAALSGSVFAQQGASGGSKADSAAVAQAASANATKAPLSKQTSVQRTTKKTNWSKIKTMFE